MKNWGTHRTSCLVDKERDFYLGLKSCLLTLHLVSSRFLVHLDCGSMRCRLRHKYNIIFYMFAPENLFKIHALIKCTCLEVILFMTFPRTCFIANFGSGEKENLILNVLARAARNCRLWLWKTNCSRYFIYVNTDLLWACSKVRIPPKL